MSESPPRVLLVDDDAEVRRVIGRILRRIGCDVVEAGSGEEALAGLEELSAPPFALFFLDVNLPGLSGVELADRLAARFPAVPVLFISGDTSFARLGDVQRPGRRFLAKPFRMSVLEGYVCGLLNIRRGTQPVS